MSFWGVTLKACEAYTLTPESPLHVTKAVLEAETEPSKGRNMVQCRVGDGEPVCVCSLRAETEEQTGLDLVFEQGTAVTFLTSGPGTVDLSGYFVQHFVESGDQNGDDDDEDDEDYVDEGDDDDDDDEEEEMDDDEEEEEEEEPEEEEKKEEEEKGKKRTREAEGTKAQPQKRVCASPEAPARKSGAGEKPKSVHFDEAKAPATPERPRTTPAHPQTPYSRPPARTVPDTIVPPSPAQSAKPAKQEKPEKPAQAAARNSSSKGAASPAAAQQQKQQQQQQQPATRRTPEGLTITDTRVGTGAVARPGCTVQVRYTGALTSGKVFDKSGRTPFRFDLGTGEVIRGWDLGVKDMRVGGKRRLVVPPHLGYGHSRAGPIPPNSTLVFDVELVSVH